MKLYAVVNHHRNSTTTVYGTVADLVKYFGYTLACGHSWNYKINPNPTTFKSFMSNYSKSIDETQGGCYHRDYLTETPVTDEMKQNYNGTAVSL